MSRTFRLRHYPKLKAKKFVNGSADRQGRYRRDRKLWNSLGVVIDSGNWPHWTYTLHRADKVTQFEALRSSAQYNVASVHWHPWLRHRGQLAENPRKKESSQQAHRAFRSRFRIELKKLIDSGEYDDLDMPPLKWYLDTWDVT